MITCKKFRLFMIPSINFHGFCNITSTSMLCVLFWNVFKRHTIIWAFCIKHFSEHICFRKRIKVSQPECDEKPISILETGTGISFFQSHVRDRNKNFFLSISCIETRTRISSFNLRLRDENENRDWDNSRKNFQELHLLLVYWLIFSKKNGC